MLWRTDTWEPVSVLKMPQLEGTKFSGGLAFHPKAHNLIILGEDNSIIAIGN